MSKCIFVFRRDLRLRDNTALLAAMKDYTEILPIFIYDSNQLKPTNGKPKSENFVQMMVSGVRDLALYIEAQNGHLSCFYGVPHKVLDYLIAEWKPDAIAFNLDYSEYALERDRTIKALCERSNIKLITAHDTMLTNYKLAMECQSRAYWEFVKKIGQIKTVVHDFKPNTKCFVKKIFSREWRDFDSFYKKNVNISITASRKFAIESIRKGENNFIESRHNIAKNGLQISVHLKLGLISPREVVEYVSKKWSRESCVEIVKQMLWRDFYSIWMIKQNSTNNFGSTNAVIDVNAPISIYDFIDHRFKSIEWLNSEKEIAAMWSGKTGVPLVDAAMRELNTTGFMHNRGRLVVGFYSVKILRINPFSEWGGQRYFSQHLVDCDSAQNTGNWHWIASDALDASGQRYGHGWSGRPMNPNKATNSDPQCEYIKKWIPELNALTAHEIDSWHKCYSELQKKHKIKYIKPIVSLKKRFEQWCAMTK